MGAKIGIEQPAVAVIMSVFNEPVEYIKEAVDSILFQTFQDFEIVVVNDNPKRTDYRRLFESYNDNRIKYHQNKENMSLAGAMNVAASLTKARYLARMDADDIAEPDRLEKEYNVLKSGKYDLVFSRYSFIDEKSTPCLRDRRIDYYPPEQLKRVMLERPLIHHPTVMMTSEILQKVGGYRKLIAAEDRDLWLRMQYEGCRFYMLEDSLLRYRINAGSISYQKRQRQILTIIYIEDLFVERLRKGYDSYSEEHCEEFLVRNGLGDVNAEKKLLHSKERLELSAKYQREGKSLKALLRRVEVFLSSKQYRMYFINKFLKKEMLKKRGEII